MPSLTPSLENALERALGAAGERDHEYATLEHLLLALTEDEDAVEVMTACKVDIPALKGALETYIDEDLSSLITHPDASSRPPLSSVWSSVQSCMLKAQAVMLCQARTS